MFNLFPRPLRILFICSENVCRSAMAEGMLRHSLAQVGLSRRVKVSSAGTAVSQPGRKPDIRAQRVLMEDGVSLRGIRAHQVTVRDLERSDYVLAMEERHLQALRELCPQGHAHKLELVLNHDPESAQREVPDPYYGNREGFTRVYELLLPAVDSLREQIAQRL